MGTFWFLRAQQRLCRKYGIALDRGYRLPHKTFPGPFKAPAAGQLALERLRSQPQPKPEPVAPVYHDGLAAFLNHFCSGRLTAPEDDALLIELFAKYIPANTPDFARMGVAMNLARAIRELWEESASPWIH